MTSQRRWVIGLVVVTGLVVAAIAIGLFTWAERESVQTINRQLEALAPWFLLWRLSLFVLLVIYWHELVGWITKSLALDATSGDALVQWRWRATAGLLVMDLVLVEDLIGKLMKVLA